MFSPRKNSLPSPSLEDAFFPLSSSSSVSLSFALPSSMSSPGSSDNGGGIETDLILAAELGQALLEKNEELAASLEQSERQVEVSKQGLWQLRKLLYKFVFLFILFKRFNSNLCTHQGTNDSILDTAILQLTSVHLLYSF